MDLSRVRIISERLIQSAVNRDYLQPIFTEFTTEITHYMIPKPSETEDVTVNFIDCSMKALREGWDLQLVILDRETGEFLGCSGLHNLPTGTPEIGIWVKKGAHGNHYGREAVGGLLAWAKRYVTYGHIIYPVDRRNIPSRRIPEYYGGKIARSYKINNEAGFELEVVEYHIAGDPAIEEMLQKNAQAEQAAANEALEATRAAQEATSADVAGTEQAAASADVASTAQATSSADVAGKKGYIKSAGETTPPGSPLSLPHYS